MKKMCQGWVWFGSCVAAGMLGGQALGAVPSAPTNLVSAADSQTQITLWWTDASSDETGFRIERSATGTNGWAQVASSGANVATYTNSGLTANTLWYYRVCATNSSGASGYANIANAHTAYYYNHGTPVWRALLLVYTNTAVDWVDSNHVTNNVTGSLSPSGVLAAEESFRLYAARAEKYSDRECIVQYDIVHVGHAVTNVTDEGGFGTSFWLSPEAIAGDLDRYAPRGVYDSILVHWYRGNMPARGWGLGMGVSSAANGATYCTVTEAWDDAWNGNNVWLHEWLHGSENVYAGRGYRQPANGADGASSHGYPETENWGLYYHDNMTCKVWDTNAPAMFTGTPAQGYRGGSVVNSKSLAQADYFTADTLTRYKKTGTAVWQSGNEYVALGTTSAATNSMYTTLIPTNSPTLTGRVFVPASGVGTNDTVSVALRSGTTEWWATIEYGTNLTKQFSLIRNGTRQAVSAASVSPGYWYTVKIAADYPADTLRMKAWRDAVNEPTNWLCTASLSGWKATEVGFRHYGKGTLVNDLFMATPEPPSFTNIVTGLPGIELGAVRWGDYDNDGKLDILIVGNSDAGRVAAVYHNMGAGTFADIGAGLPALSDADAQWGDYNNDGYLDILILGNTGSGSVTRIYRNNGNGTFTDINAGLQGFLSGRVSWGDYNNDGKLDILVAGYASGQKSKVYRNDGGGIFTDINAGLIGSEKGVAKWGDYDNDGYLDILLAGYTGSAYSTKIYHNNGDGTFADINAGLHGVGYASGAWGDYDNDGYLDFAISGFDGSARPTIIYHNDGDGTFTEINAYLTSVADSDITWGDYDNDGDLDLLYGGYNGGIATYLYRNEGNSTFSTQASPFANVRNCSMAWGDYDNDGRLDVLLSGYDGAIRVAGLYRNADASVPVNTVPAAPSGLSATATDPVTIRLSWNDTTDGQTLANGLTYNLRVGTTSGGSDVVGPMADTANGWRRIPAMGGVSGTNCVISGLVNGATYYWSVQAVDSAFAGGAFATQGMFTAPVPPVVTTDPISNITVSSAQCGGNLTAAGTPAAIAKGLVWNTAPHPEVTNYLGKTDHGAGTGSFSDTITSLTPGQSYYVRAYASSSLGATYGASASFRRR